MNGLLARAAALKELVSSAEPSPLQPTAEAVINCCNELVLAGEAQLALSLIDSARDLAQSAGEEWLLRLNLIRIRALKISGRLEDSLALTKSILVGQRDLLERAPLEHSYLRVWEASVLWRLNRVNEAIDKLEALRGELLNQPDSAPLAWCSYELAGAHIFYGDPAKGRALSLEALVSSRRCRLRIVEAMALDNLSRLDKSLCRWSSAEDHTSEALAIYEADGNRIHANVARRFLGIIEWKRGRLDAAQRLADESLAEARQMGSGLSEWYASLLKGMIMLHRGKYEDAERLFSGGVHWDIPKPESRPSLLTLEFKGDLLLEQGRAVEALKKYDDVWLKTIALVPKGDLAGELRRRRAEALCLLKADGESYAEARAGVAHCRDLGDRYEEAATYRILALSAAALGRTTEAKQWFDQGFAYYEDIETPYEWGKLWMAYGDWLRGPHAGEYRDDRAALEAYYAARDHFAGMGAEAKLAEVTARIGDMSSSHGRLAAEVADAAITSPLVRDLRGPQRRPRGMAELDRRSAWARESFGFVTRSKIVLDLLEMTAKLAPSGSPILILGESGTGKELVAHGIHKLSCRSGSFMPINCSAVPRDVIESELFGHVAGAFTGATRDKPGLFEACDHGTVFLDEIAEMSLDLQSRLLRFLEKGEFRRVGSNKLVAVDTQIVAATNRDRGSLEKGETFRPDLYYRLAHAVITIPPLRRRPEDVDLLVGHFLEEACVRYRKEVSLSDEARNQLVTHSWPGNARQLRSTVTRLVVLADPHQPIPPEAVHLDEAQAAGSLMEELEQAERQRIAEALAQARGVRTEAAKALGMSRTTFIGKMKRYGIR